MACCMLSWSLSIFATHAVLMKTVNLGHYSGWPISIVVGVIIVLAVIRMTREKFLPLEENRTSRIIIRIYKPALSWVLHHKKVFLIAPLLVLFIGLTLWLGIGKTLAPVGWFINLFAYESMSPELKRVMYVKEDEHAKRPLIELSQLRWQTLQYPNGSLRHRFLLRRQDPKEQAFENERGIRVIQENRILSGLGREFMPPLDEGSFLYMPSLLPQTGIGPAIEINSKQDRAIASVPEVESVVGKIGRSESALDPAPISMMETIVILKPESEWRHIPVRRFFSNWPNWLKQPFTLLWPEDSYPWRAPHLVATHSNSPCDASNRISSHDGC